MIDSLAAQTKIIVKAHYPLTTRLLVDLYEAGALPDVSALEIEPVYGYVGRVLYQDGGVRLFRYTNTGVNNHGAAEIAKDKGYTRYFLQHLGYRVPAGKTFLLPDYAQLIDGNLGGYGFTDYETTMQIEDYINTQLGYPCVIKPNDGSQGRGVFRCDEAAQVREALVEYQQDHVRLVVVEQWLALPDYRVVVLDGAVQMAYHRQPPQIIGDGETTISGLIAALHTELRLQKRPVTVNGDDVQVRQHLSWQGLTLESVPTAGQVVTISALSNLSGGGMARDVSDQLHPHWRDLCVAITAEMGLRLCGVDLACADIRDPEADYAIFELNSSPGMDHYAALGQHEYDRVRDLMRHIFESKG